MERLMVAELLLIAAFLAAMPLLDSPESWAEWQDKMAVGTQQKKYDAMPRSFRWPLQIVLGIVSAILFGCGFFLLYIYNLTLLVFPWWFSIPAMGVISFVIVKGWKKFWNKYIV